MINQLFSAPQETAFELGMCCSQAWRILHFLAKKVFSGCPCSVNSTFRRDEAAVLLGHTMVSSCTLTEKATENTAFLLRIECSRVRLVSVG